jgi:PhnB protein
MNEQPTPEHNWLQKFVGEWTWESDCSMGPDQPPMKSSGTERVRSLGGLWTIGEGIMGTGEAAGKSILTLGYDPRTKRFVGTFVASMMTHLWPYNGVLDASGRVLVLDSEGPSFSGDGSVSKYQDIYEFIDDNHRTLISRMLMPNGEWVQFMSAHYHRVLATDSPSHSAQKRDTTVNPTITPYLFFGGRCQEALEFYQKALGAKIDMMLRFNQSPDPVPEGMLQPGFENKIMHASFRIGGVFLMASDGCDAKPKFDGFRLSLAMPTEAEAHKAFRALAEGGTIQMPLGKTFWSPCYGMVTDRFNVGWMVTVVANV